MEPGLQRQALESLDASLSIDQFAETRPEAMLTLPREDTIDPSGLGKLGSCHLVGLR